MVTFPVIVKRVINKVEWRRSFSLNKREHALFMALKEANGEVVSIPKLLRDLEIRIEHLRVSKRNLERLLEGWIFLGTVYGNGYFMRFLDYET